MAQIFNIHGGDECATGQKQLEMELAKMVMDAQGLFFMARGNPEYMAEMKNLIYFAHGWLSLALMEIEQCGHLKQPQMSSIETVQ